MREEAQRKMEDFVLIDLLAQREAVYKHVAGWSPDEILAWMEHYGKVVRHEVEQKWGRYTLYSFQSNVDGRLYGFFFTDNGKLALIR
jgi:hypothetical protein